MEECFNIRAGLTEHINTEISILTGDEKTYQAGVMLLPSYAAKGLEFDAVLIINLEYCYQFEDMDIKLLYVAMTRAMHKLFVFYMEGTIPILEESGVSACRN